MDFSNFLVHIYTFIFVIAHLKALYLRPIEVHSNILSIKNGLFANTDISFSDISTIHIFEKDIGYKRKDFFRFALIKKLENHNIIIILNQDIKVKIIYDFSKTVKKIYLYVNGKNEFCELINKKMVEGNLIHSDL